MHNSDQDRMNNEMEDIKEREKRMKERDLEGREEMKRVWEMIGVGAEAGAAKVVEDPRPKTSIPKDVKTET